MDYTALVPQYFNNTNATTAQFATSYVNNLPQLIFDGDLAATMLSLILFFILLWLVNKLSSILLAVVKRTIIFIITFLILREYIPLFTTRILTEGFTPENALFGLAGILLCFVAFTIATLALLKDTKRAIRRDEAAPHQEESVSFKLSDISKDRSLLNVLIYLIVAEFGVFSSVTLAAPNVRVGIVFLAVFLVASLVFIKQSYHNYKIGLSHLAVVLVVGFFVSILLGLLWGNQTLGEILSINYFTSDALVALITGVAVALFAGSKQ
ncbi:MAG: hypothetical protein ABIG95_04185 [Candidatus Woesearchaeota archaeon]